MAKHRTRVGVHARNAVQFTEADYQLVRLARIETLKTMSQTETGVYKRLRQENPDLEFIVRLFDDRVRNRSYPEPAAFVARMAPIVNSLKPYATKFEMHNEPNHADGLEGWGATDANARAFLSWYMHVLQALKKACPWASFGFPGLAINSPHRDLEWLSICREAVAASDWLGCHCYWQYGNMMSDDWGLRFKLYHQRFPDKTIEITEFGNSTPNLAPEEMARQYTQYYQELNKYYYLASASAYIASSPDPAWAPFAWVREGGQMLPVVKAVGSMDRKPVELVAERYFSKTGKTVKGAFLDFFDLHGLEVCGYPITDQIKEDGFAAQYFERLAMEEPKRGRIVLKAVGSEAWTSRPKIAELEAMVEKLSLDPIPSVEGVIDKLSRLTEAQAAQIAIVQRELARLKSLKKPGDSEKLIKVLGEQVAAMQKLSEGLHVELAAALKAMSEEQVSLIEYLQDQVAALGGQAEQGEAQPAPSTPTPKTVTVSRPAIQDITAQLPTHATARYAQRSRKTIGYLIVHHSALAASVGPRNIASYMVREWEWPGIGYHFVVGEDGTIYQTNALETVSYHASGFNTKSVGICFLGNFQEQVPPTAQLQAGAHLLAWLLQELGFDPDVVKGHKELMQTACPGVQWTEGLQWKKLLSQAIVKRQQGSS